MLKIRPTYKKPQSIPKKVKIGDNSNIQNTKPISFNTKGYFSPDEPYNEDYLKVKMEVFKKYRQENQQLVVIDKNSIHKGHFIQRGLMNLNNNITNVPLGNHNERVFNTFIKNYMNRKEKKQKIDEKKYNPSKSGALSEIRGIEPSVRDFHSCRSSRASKSIVSSRQTTARSIVSYQDLQ